MMSTNMVALYMEEQGINVKLLNSLEFMRLKANEEPDMEYLAEKLTPQIESRTDGKECRRLHLAGQNHKTLPSRPFVLQHYHSKVKCHPIFRLYLP